MFFKKMSIASAICLSITAASYSPLTMAQTISGKVVDHQNNAVGFAKVKIKGSDREITTDSSGRFSFTALDAGEFELHISAKNYAHNREHITLAKNDIDNVTIKLAPSVMEVLDVYSTPLHSSTIESAQPVNVLSGDDLKLKQASTLGETLKNEVGVHSSFYGSVASSPIIRGLDGPRVLITQNGLDAGDASRVGADHTVSAETSTATQIEVLRGPATLFYGSGAIGGVVNVVDNRVPTSTDTMADWLLQYNDASDEQQASLAFQTGSDNVAFHFDGFWRDSGNYKLPSDFDAHAFESEEEHEEHEDEEEEEQSSHLENSFSKSHGFTVGSSYLFDQGFIGFSVGSMSKDYGVPGHSHAHEEEGEEDHGEHEEEGTLAEMKQDRVQLLSEVTFNDDFIKQLSTKISYTDYEHKEIEDGAVGTIFKNKSTEAKADLYHQDYMGWQGAWTLHYKHSDFEAIGDEAFAPPSKTDSFAIAWLEEKHFGDVLLQLGARVEHVEIDANDADIGFHEDEVETVSFATQDFTPVSASAGLVWEYTDGYNLGFSVSFSQRAPSAAEIFSFGPHIGAGTFEIGSMFELHLEEHDEHEEDEHEEEHEEHEEEIHVELADHAPEIETSYNIDLTWRKFEGDFGFVVSAFYNHIEDYYYQQDTGLFFEDSHEAHEEDEHDEEHEEHEEEGLPILVYQQDDVDLYGIEAEFVYQVNDSLKATLYGDYINASLSDGGDLPRTPPMRVGALFNYQGNSFDSEFNLSHYFEQNDIAPLETVTPSYTLVGFNFNYYINNLGFSGLNNDVVLYVKGENLTDEVAHVHSSFLKEIAPLPGRSFSIGIRGSF